MFQTDSGTTFPDHNSSATLLKFTQLNMSADNCEIPQQSINQHFARAVSKHTYNTNKTDTSLSKFLPRKTELRLFVYSLHCPLVNHSNVQPSFHFEPQRRKKSFRDHIEVRRMKPNKRKRKRKKILIHTVRLLHVHQWRKSKHREHELVKCRHWHTVLSHEGPSAKYNSYCKGFYQDYWG